MRKMFLALLLGLAPTLPVGAQSTGPRLADGRASEYDIVNGTFELTGGRLTNRVVPIIGMTWSQVAGGTNRTNELPEPLAGHRLTVDVELIIGDQRIIMKGPVPESGPNNPGGPGGPVVPPGGGLGNPLYIIEVYSRIIPAVWPPMDPIPLIHKEARLSDGELCLLESDYDSAGAPLPFMDQGGLMTYDGFVQSTVFGTTMISEAIGATAEFEMKIGGAPHFLGNSFRRVSTQFYSFLNASGFVRDGGPAVGRADSTQFAAITEDDLHPIDPLKLCNYDMSDPWSSGACWGGWFVGAGVNYPISDADAGGGFSGGSDSAPEIKVIDNTDIQWGFAGKGYIELKHKTKTGGADLPLP